MEPVSRLDSRTQGSMPTLSCLLHPSRDPRMCQMRLDLPPYFHLVADRLIVLYHDTQAPVSYENILAETPGMVGPTRRTRPHAQSAPRSPPQRGCGS